jgi:hypothetical protein
MPPERNVTTPQAPAVQSKGQHRPSFCGTRPRKPVCVIGQPPERFNATVDRDRRPGDPPFGRLLPQEINPTSGRGHPKHTEPGHAHSCARAARDGIVSPGQLITNAEDAHKLVDPCQPAAAITSSTCKRILGIWVFRATAGSASTVTSRRPNASRKVPSTGWVGATATISDGCLQ